MLEPVYPVYYQREYDLTPKCDYGFRQDYSKPEKIKCGIDGKLKPYFKHAEMPGCILGNVGISQFYLN